MPDTHSPNRIAARDEKLHAIAAMFGPDVAAQVGPAPSRGATDPAVDPDRVAWHQNRLIRHLRDHAPKPGAVVRPKAAAIRPDHHDVAATQTRPTPAVVPERAPALQTLAHGAGAGELAGEHPAIIAHILKSEPQSVRVSVLKQLPGQTARAVMQRLRAR
jgi:hypothetical protein